MKSQTIQNKHYSIEIFSGTVTDFSQRSETHVSGSGSEGSVEINSKVTNHLRFFLVDENGVEKDFQVTDWDFPMRVGHQIQVFAAFTNVTKNNGLILAIKNNNIGDISINYEMIKEFSQSRYALFFLIGIALIVASLVFGMTLVFLDIYLNDTLGKIISNIIFYSIIGCFIFYNVQWRRLNFNLKKQLKQITK